MRGSKGSSLPELMITVGIVSILGLGIASAFTFGVTQFALLQEENIAQTNVQQAAYYLKLFMSNALKVQCWGPVIAPTAINANNPVTLVDTTKFVPGGIPAGAAGVPDGFIDCRALGTPNAIGVVTPVANLWPSTLASALGVFYRENYAFNLPTSATSTFQAAAVYYQGPDGTSDNNMGVLVFTFQGAGLGSTTVSSTGSAITIDHISNIQILGFTTAPVFNTATGITYNMLQTITYQITARYMSTRGFRNFSPDYTTSGPATAGNAMVNDVVQQVQISFHDNYLGPDLSSPSSPTSERLNGGLYYYKFIAPSVSGI